MTTQQNTNSKARFLSEVKDRLGDIDLITRKQIKQLCREASIPFPSWFTHNMDYRVSIGTYSINFARQALMNQSPSTEFDAAADNKTQISMLSAVTTLPEHKSNYVPEPVPGYVSFGHHQDVKSVIRSREFYPMYITGLSGNGKTMMVEQACSQENRECVRINITIETDEDDLIGGFRLTEGRTVWHDGPVITAMQRGAVLLLDEVDLGSNKLMCLQPVLEGRPIYLKKVGRVVEPAPGFNIVATANTKGKGSDDGRFIGTNVMNEAFLERFSVTFDQEYPSEKVETRILNSVLAQSGQANETYVKNLVKWASLIRKSFNEGAISEVISTRRLVHICKAYVIFGKEDKAIKLCLARFDTDTSKSFLEVYEKLIEPAPENPTPVPPAGDEVPF